MKRITMLLGVGILFLSPMAYAAVPQLINFQGILRDESGDPVGDGNYSLAVKIYDVASGPNAPLWSDNFTVATSGGLFNVNLGSGIPLDTALFSNPNLWVGVSVGTDPEASPRTQLTSVPYSARVGTVDGATGGVISGDVSIQSNLAVEGAMNAKNMVLVNPGPINTPLVIQGSPGQSANLMEIKDGAGAPLVTVNASGTWQNKILVLDNDAAAETPLSIQGSPGQTANLLEIKDGTGATLLSVDPAGTISNFPNPVPISIGGASSGGAEISGNDLIVSTGSSQFLNPVGIGTTPSAAPDVLLRVESGGTMHELGHNLGVHHTGPSNDDFFQAWDGANKVASIDALGNMTLDGDMDGISSSWETVHAVDINCDGTLNTGGDAIVGGNVGIGTPTAHSPLQVNGSIATKVTFVSQCATAITLDGSNSVVLVASVLGAECFVNLPAASGISGRQYTVKNVGPGSVSIIPVSGQTIDGSTVHVLVVSNKYVVIISDGANWQIIGNN